MLTAHPPKILKVSGWALDRVNGAGSFVHENKAAVGGWAAVIDLLSKRGFGLAIALSRSPSPATRSEPSSRES
jgi:hypothetical protein